MTAPCDDQTEWLETDGLGGFASGTAGGIRTRRYHGLLLAATNPPSGAGHATERHLMRYVVLSLVPLLFASVALASDGASRHANLGKDRLALQGYDPVSYFGTERPSKGSDWITAEHDGAVYRFESAQNRERFLAEPQKYLPQYGGWCATAMAEGKKVQVDPRNYRVTDGRLFLFYKSLIHDAQDDWEKNEPRLTRKADDAWGRITSEK
jgi:hypothetical protein